MLIQRVYMLSQFFLTLQLRQLLAALPDSGGDTQICQQENDDIKCQLQGDTLQLSYEKWRRYYYAKMECSKAPNNIEMIIAQLPDLELHNETRFELTDCLQMPHILSRKDIFYKGAVTFSTQRMPHDFFWKSNGLRWLQLNIGYAIETLPSQLFANLTELKILAINIEKIAADIFTVPTELFHTLSNLESLKFEVLNTWKRLNGLTSEHFQHLSSLKHFFLTGNNLGTLSADIFSSLTELTYLNLEGNGLVSLPPNLLESQGKLTFLDLSTNLLDYLPLGLFNKTHLLWTLNLSYNKFSSPSNIIETIRSLHYLRELDLSQNYFNTIVGTASYANETILTSFSHNDGSMLQLHVEVPSDIFLRFSFFPNGIQNFARDEIATETSNSISIYLRYNKISYFNMDWITEARLSCPFTIDLNENQIKNVYALSQPLFSTTAFCSRSTVIFDYNPTVCDCKLAWIFNNNYLQNMKFSACSAQPNSYEMSNIQRLHRSEFCDWQPALCPSECVCSIDAAILHINCAGAKLAKIHQLPRPEQYSGNKNVTLTISHNNFYELPLNTTLGYANVTHLNASYNHITEILTTQLPANLTTLDLRNNRLASLSHDILMACLNESRTLKKIYLAQNPWKCDCSAKPFLLALRANSDCISDAEQLICDNEDNERLLDVDVDAICANYNLYTILIYVLIGAAFVFLIAITFFFKYQLQVKVWLYSHKMCLCFIKEHELDKHRNFDAFISYAHQDANFVNHTLLPQLERGDPPYRICTHERNWLPGAFIPEQIVESVAQSRRTIIVLSQHFIDSDWARMEFRTAHHASLNEGHSRIIIIKYGELTNTELLDRELQAYLEINTYLVWEDCEWFWSKLRYAMPHKKGEARDAGMLELRERVYVMGQVEMNNQRDEQQ